MADLRFKDKNNNKKKISAFASSVISTSATMDEILFTLPAASLVTRAYAVVLTPSGSASNTVDIKVGSLVVGSGVIVGNKFTGSEVDFDPEEEETPTRALLDASVGGVQEGTQTKAYFSTGGLVTVVAGEDAPDDTGRIKIVVEYIETELAEGAYTD
jgi:hypothetical protein